MSLTLRQICLVAEKRQPVIDDLVAVLGVEVCYVDPHVEVFGLENALVAVDTNFIEVVAPIAEKTAAGRYLDRRCGNGGYMIITQSDNAETQAACRARAADLNVRVAFETPHDTGNYLQLHPADTGGSFFEIDWDQSNNPIGNWAPAGGTGWEKHVRTHVISALKGAELQSSEPESLARRWSSITGIELRKDAAGSLEMPLNNAVIRFVQADDGRGEGLGGIDIEASDPKKLLQAAEDRGLKISDTRVMICGVRFNLV
ncbi:MAG: hypothetical protein HOB38_13950 [Deltaproteobacteria bacterium]|nr:hypothetical protein [Deltaproteobacteria bacterium]